MQPTYFLAGLSLILGWLASWLAVNGCVAGLAALYGSSWLKWLHLWLAKWPAQKWLKVCLI